MEKGKETEVFAEPLPAPEMEALADKILTCKAQLNQRERKAIRWALIYYVADDELNGYHYKEEE